jgi:hypothetical protein
MTGPSRILSSLVERVHPLNRLSTFLAVPVEKYHLLHVWEAVWRLLRGSVKTLGHRVDPGALGWPQVDGPLPHLPHCSGLSTLPPLGLAWSDCPTPTYPDCGSQSLPGRVGGQAFQS